MILRLLLLALSLAASLRVAAATPQDPGVTIYVSPLGRDAWSGSLPEPTADRSDGPLATLGRARDRLRELPPAGGARVLLRGGTYRLESPVVFGPEDSGGEGAPRSYESFPGEMAIVSGTQLITAPWKEAGDNVYVAEVPMGSFGSFRTLFVDGKRATWARFPNEGFLQATGGKGKTRIETAPGAAKPAWADDPAATVNIIAERGWYNQLVRVAGVGAAGDWIELAGRECQGSILAGNRFFVEGVRAELDQEGEWYFDRKSGRLYYYSKSPPDGRRFEIATVDRLFEVRGRVGQPVRHLAFRGLGLFGSDFTVDHVAVRTNQDAAIHLINAHDVEITHCRFEAVGGYAVWLHLDARGNVIRDNEIVDGGAGGILLTSARFSYASDNDVYDPAPDVQRVAPGGNIILGNHIHRGGAIRAYCSGVHLDSRPQALSQAQGNYVGFNHIHHMPRNGIFAFRNQGGNIFEANHIHDVLQRTNDGGAVHLASMNPLCAPTHILDNRIYRVGYQGGKTNANLSFGIYPDWFTSRLVIRGNVVTDTRDGGIRLLGGDDALIEGNLVGDDPTASVVFGAWTTNSVSGIVLRDNRIVNGKGSWVRYFTGGSSASAEVVAGLPGKYWAASGNLYWGRTTGGGIVIAKDSRGAARPGDCEVTLAALQQLATESGSMVRDFGGDEQVNTSGDPESFGLGSATFRRMAAARTSDEARRALQRLEGSAIFVAHDDARGVTMGGDWKPEPTKINEFLAFADLKQAVSRTRGAAITFAADLAPGAYVVYGKWYGAAGERAAAIEVEMSAAAAAPQTVRLNHRQEGHKWLRLGVVECRGTGPGTVVVRNSEGGLAAMHSVAWVKQSAPGGEL